MNTTEKKILSEKQLISLIERVFLAGKFELKQPRKKHLRALCFHYLLGRRSAAPFQNDT